MTAAVSGIWRQSEGAAAGGALRRGRLSGNGRCLRSRAAPRDAAIKTFGNIRHGVHEPRTHYKYASDEPVNVL